ncbi:cyclodeaminase/cyclohydrolase family protein [Natranaerobius thermophilus]|uniref:Formiminotransferase-cyclodeaminase n=1 Tax=Natranaerobius thermophilus (strain ATCC BAA-1301 / DSM 18059 / JW/NM-WN-LF) TaxID=457570 RepID=B2A5T1_NATTJ|nr:cyclodeaminase/cyclohydrolase family protein [Natranaerobius thermophilus]ACB84024.1 Formiminotransferase-cyclodeaminase [Natranaerobius thermophilus JW/NM-WN-LF]
MSLTEKTVEEFLEVLSSKEPAPGGGSVSALAGSLGSCLTTMVGNLTIGKKRYRNLDEAEQRELDEKFEQVQKIKTNLDNLIDRDKEAFDEVMAAVKMPKETEEEKAKRREALQKATQTALEVPLETARECLKVLQLQEAFARNGNPNAITDVGVGALMAYAGIEGAIYNVKINLSDLKDENYKKQVEQEVEKLLTEGQQLKEKIQSMVDEKM